MTVTKDVTRVPHPPVTAMLDAPPGSGLAARAPAGPHTTLARRGLVLATLAIGTAYASALAMETVPAWAAWLMATGVPVALVSIMALGAARNGRVPASLMAAFALVGLVLLGGFAFALLAPAGGLTGDQEPLLLGLPRRAAVLVYGIGLLPVLVLPVAYALTFEAQTLRPEDLARVQAAGALAATERARVQAAAPGTPGGAR